jgi:anti-anti-sigma regulatory factor
MAVQIQENKGIFELSGSLSAQNLRAIQTYFLFVLEQQPEIVINVENLEAIDSSALHYLKELPAVARGMEARVTVVGMEIPQQIDTHTE